MPHKVMAVNIVSHATRLNRLPRANSPPKVLRFKCVKWNLCIAYVKLDTLPRIWQKSQGSELQQRAMRLKVSSNYGAVLIPANSLRLCRAKIILALPRKYGPIWMCNFERGSFFPSHERPTYTYQKVYIISVLKTFVYLGRFFHSNKFEVKQSILTLILLMWRIGWAHNNARK